MRHFTHSQNRRLHGIPVLCVINLFIDDFYSSLMAILVTQGENIAMIIQSRQLCKADSHCKAKGDTASHIFVVRNFVVNPMNSLEALW